MKTSAALHFCIFPQLLDYVSALRVVIITTYGMLIIVGTLWARTRAELWGLPFRHVGLKKKSLKWLCFLEMQLLVTEATRNRSGLPSLSHYNKMTWIWLSTSYYWVLQHSRSESLKELSCPTALHFIQLNNSVHSHYREVNSCSVTSRNLRNTRNRQIHSHIQRIPPLNSILSQVNLVSRHTILFIKDHFQYYLAF